MDSESVDDPASTVGQTEFEVVEAEESCNPVACPSRTSTSKPATSE